MTAPVPETIGILRDKPNSERALRLSV